MNRVECVVFVELTLVPNPAVGTPWVKDKDKSEGSKDDYICVRFCLFFHTFI